MRDEGRRSGRSGVVSGFDEPLARAFSQAIFDHARVGLHGVSTREIRIACGAVLEAYLGQIEPVETRREVIEQFCAELRARTGVGRPA